MSKLVYLFGDSNTYGYDPREHSSGRYPEEIVWTSLLAEKLKGSWEVVADGKNGRPVPDLDYDLDWLNRSFDRFSNIDLFVCMLGTNDILFSMETDAQAIAAKMEEFIDYLQGKPQIKNILLLAPVWIGEELLHDLSYLNFRAESKALNQYYKELADSHGLYFADCNTWGVPLAYDYVHFTEEAQAIFADKMMEVIGDVDV